MARISMEHMQCHSICTISPSNLQAKQCRLEVESQMMEVTLSTQTVSRKARGDQRMMSTEETSSANTATRHILAIPLSTRI